MRILLLIIFLLIVNCKFNKVVDSHGVHFLDKKQQKLSINHSNKNDILELLGPPSTKSAFNSDLWIYLESNDSVVIKVDLIENIIFPSEVLSTLELFTYSEPKVSSTQA